VPCALYPLLCHLCGLSDAAFCGVIAPNGISLPGTSCIFLLHVMYVNEVDRVLETAANIIHSTAATSQSADSKCVNWLSFNWFYITRIFLVTLH